jgi:hypothetical protein
VPQLFEPSCFIDPALQSSDIPLFSDPADLGIPKKKKSRSVADIHGVEGAALAESCEQIVLHTLFINPFPTLSETKTAFDIYWTQACTSLGRRITMSDRSISEVYAASLQPYEASARR